VAPASDLAGRRWLVLLSATASFFAVGLGFYSVPAALPALTAAFSLSNLAAGVLMGSIAVPAVFLSIPLGAAVDRFAARRSGTLGLTLMAVGCGLFAFAPSYGALAAGRVLFGVGGLVINLLQARLLARAFAGRELSLAMGIFLAAYPVSMIVSFTVLPLLEPLSGWRGVLAVPAVLSAAVLPLHLAAVHAGREPTGPGRSPLDVRPVLSRRLLALGAAWCLFFAAYASLVTFAPAWAGTSGLLVVSVVAWAALLAGPPAGALIDRTRGAHRWASAALAGFAAVLVAMALGVLPALPAMVVVGLVVAVVPTAVYSLPGRLVAAESVGLAFGLITSLSNLGTVAGPALAGAVRDREPSWPLLWLLLAATAAVAGAMVLAARPRD